MSLHPEDRADSENEEARIADYLIAHPDFLDRHPEVLSALQIAHESGGAVSLIERQVRQLRADSGRYRRQLEELIEVGRENDRLTAKLHQLILALIDAANLDEVLGALQDQLRDQFQADAVELKLFSADELERQADEGESGAALFSDFMAKGRPSCGELPAAQLQYLFDDQLGDTGSVALVPLNAGEQEGILAIGSHDPERFHAAKGLDFLTRLGEIVGHALRAVSSPGA